jgi:hypothetical protein
MNEQLIEKLISYLEKSETFVYEQAPDFIQQLLSYEKVSSIVGTFIFSVIIIFCVCLALYHIFNPDFERNELRTMGNQMLCFMPFLVAMISLAPFCSCLSTWIKINMAPKVFLLEYLMKIKG